MRRIYKKDRKINTRLLRSRSTYYVMSTRMKIKCRSCGTVLYQDMFSQAEAGAICSCNNISIQTLNAPDTKFGYWVTLRYQDKPPIIIEKAS